jgi:hypothetical protein
MASGHVNRVKRPNTWLHRPMLQNVKKVLANPEPSTHDPKETPKPRFDRPLRLARDQDGSVFRAQPRFDALDQPLPQ